MRPSLLSVRLAALVLALAATLSACDSGPGASLYDPEFRGNVAPVIDAVSPSGVVLAGIDVVTITGRNFSATAAENIVAFDDAAGASARGTVLEASPTTLRVRVPNLPNPALRVRVAVLGAPEYSNAMPLPLASATTPFGGLDPGIREEVAGIASSASGTLYGSLASDGVPRGVWAFAPDGARSLYFASTQVWSDLAVAPDGEVYGVRRLRAVFRLPRGGTQQTYSVLPNGVTLAAIAAAPNGDLWTGGSNSTPADGRLYRISPGGASTAYPFTETVRDLAVSGGALYVASVDGVASVVRRFPINADGSLGAGSLVYDVTAALGPTVTVNAVAVATDGTVFVGTTGADPVIEIAPNGTAAALFPGVLQPPVSSLAWSTGSRLFVTQERIGETVGTPAVPARLYRLETRRAGPF